jgi:hypothetical protein
MNYLRKNGKFIMVVMSIVCMVTFVVGAALTDWANSSRRAAGNPNPIAVTWVKGKVHDSDLGLLRRRHAAALEFLYTVVDTTLQRGGRPTINGQQITPERAMQGVDVGIPRDNSEETAIQTMVMAEEGRRMGIVVDNDAVFTYLGQISSPELKQGDWYQIATPIAEKFSVSVSQLIEHLAYELRGQHVRTLMASGLYSQGIGMPIVPPAEAFDMFNRLNRKLAIEAYPIEVESYLKEVKGEPTNTEVEKLFNEGRYRDPDPNVDEPGFHKPHKLAFKFLKVSFAPFLEEAKKQITEEQIEEAYQKDISQGLHKVQELPAEPEKKESTEATPEKPADGQTPDAAKDAAKPATESSATEKPADGKPEEKKPEEKSAGNPTEKTDKGGCEATDDPPAADKPAENKPAGEKSAEPKSDNATAETPATEKPDVAAPADTATTAPPATEPKFKPLSEVHDQILTRLAQPIAEEARKKAVAEVTTAVEKYGKALRRYNDVKSVKKTADVQAPPTLDLAPIAVKYGFEIGETPLVDRHEVAKYDIGQKVQQIDMQALQMFRQIRMLSFADIAFSQDEPLFKPDEARSSESDVNYIYFRTAEEKPADVTLKEVRPQIVEFWKKRKAFELALMDAQKLAEKAKGPTTLFDVVPDRTKVVEPPAFSWMMTGGFGMGRPEFSTVQGIELAGREFMQGVFSLKPAEAGAAPNQPHSRVYVVRVKSQEPDDARLQTQFSEMGYNQLVLMLASDERQFAWAKSLQNIEDEYRVTWQRPPRNDRRM